MKEEKKEEIRPARQHTEIGNAGRELLTRVRLELRTPLGRLRFDSDDVVECVGRYREWFQLSPDAPLSGTVQRFRPGSHAEPCGPPTSLEVELASAAEQPRSIVQTASFCRNLKHG